jgi:hypothetical protein
MIITLKYFYEKNDADFKENIKLWDENTERMIVLPTGLSLSQQVCSIKDAFEKNTKKDILAMRFQSYSDIQKNNIVHNVIFGYGVYFGNDTKCHPKEVWIYSP